MAAPKPAYLICGDDDAKIDEWRARLRVRAGAVLGLGALESFDGRSASPADVAAAVMALTFATGTRYLLADGIEGWKAPDLAPLEAALGQVPPDTVLVLIARGKPPGKLAKAVESAGGETREYGAPKGKEVPGWVIARAKEHGLGLDMEAAKALVAIVGTGQQRLLREIEKLEIAAHPEKRIGAETIEELAAGSTSSGVFALADALVAGDVQATLTIAEELAATGERPGKLLFPVVRRLREVSRIAQLLAGGVSEQQAAAAVKGPPWAAKRVVAQAREADRETLERAVERFADLEVETRGGGELDDQTAFTLALASAASG